MLCLHDKFLVIVINHGRFFWVMEGGRLFGWLVSCLFVFARTTCVRFFFVMFVSCVPITSVLHVSDRIWLLRYPVTLLVIVRLSEPKWVA